MYYCRRERSQKERQRGDYYSSQNERKLFKPKAALVGFKPTPIRGFQKVGAKF